jgi:hypothetical protein
VVVPEGWLTAVAIAGGGGGDGLIPKKTTIAAPPPAARTSHNMTHATRPEDADITASMVNIVNRYRKSLDVEASGANNGLKYHLSFGKVGRGDFNCGNTSNGLCCSLR